MSKLVKVLNKKHRGFTLVELIIVIAIIAILAAIAIPMLSAYKADAQLSADKASAAIIYKSAQMYLSAHGDLTGFDAADYIDDVVPTFTGGEEDGVGGVTAVTVGDATFPES